MEPLPEGRCGGRRGGGERSRCKIPPTPTRRIKVTQTSGTEKSSRGQNVRALRLYQGVQALRQTRGGQNVTVLKKLKHKRTHTHTHLQGQTYICFICIYKYNYRSESHVSVVSSYKHSQASLTRHSSQRSRSGGLELHRLQSSDRMQDGSPQRDGPPAGMRQISPLGVLARSLMK